MGGDVRPVRRLGREHLTHQCAKKLPNASKFSERPELFLDFNGSRSSLHFSQSVYEGSNGYDGHQASLSQ